MEKRNNQERLCKKILQIDDSSFFSFEEEIIKKKLIPFQARRTFFPSQTIPFPIQKERERKESGGRRRIYEKRTSHTHDYECVEEFST